MKEIHLAKGKGVALVDDEDFEYLRQGSWWLHRSERGLYAYGRLAGQKRVVKMHRIIMSAPTGLEVDHVDHDGLNNQKTNLRLCTHRQNQMNSRKRAGCTSIFRGVYWNKQTRRWHAQAKGTEKYIYLGVYKLEVDAARAYNRFVTEHYGEFATLNAVPAD